MYIPLDMWEQVSSLVLYVSDILVGKLLSWVFPWAKQIISKTFDIKDLDKAPSILGIEINKKKEIARTSLKILHWSSSQNFDTHKR